MGVERKYRRGFASSNRVINRLGMLCLYCSRPASTVDHFVPWSITRDNRDDNLIPCCRRCNGIASDKKFATFEEKREYILDRIAFKRGLVEARCPKGCGPSYVKIGVNESCPDCGEAL